MKCKYCGAENAPGNLHCEECGIELEKCPICQKAHEIKKFCSVKGGNVKKFLEQQEKGGKEMIKKKAVEEKFTTYKQRIWKKIFTPLLCVCFVVLLCFFWWLAGSHHAVTELKISVTKKVFFSLGESLLIIFLLSIFGLFINYQICKRTFAKQFPDDAKYLE